MAPNTKLLSANQLFFLIVQSVSSVMLFTIPFIANNNSKNNAWISVLLTLIFFQILGFAYYLLHKRLPDKNLFQMTQILASKWVGKILNWLYIVYYTTLAVYTSLYFAYLSKEWTLPVTPLFVIYLIFILLGIYLSSGKIVALARFSGISLVLMGLLIFSLFFAIPKVDVLFLLPVGNISVNDILKGSYHMGIGYAGLSSLLVLLPLVQGNQKTKKRVITLSILSISIIYLFLVTVCLAYFGTYTLKLIPIPVLYLLKTLNILSIFERMDLIITCAWITPMLITYVLYIYMVAIGISENTSFKNKKIMVWALSLLILIICAVFPLSQNLINRCSDILLPYTYIFMFGFPILLLFIAMFRKIDQSSKSGR